MKIAIVGSGIAGLTAAYLLHKNNEVQIFEKESWLGGHTHTLNVKEDGKDFPVDTGFIVFNQKTYPNFVKLMSQLNVSIDESNMSFSVSNRVTGLEYSGASLNALFSQRANLMNYRHINMLVSILRFYKKAKKIAGSHSQLTLREFIFHAKIDAYTVNNYLLPVCCSIWSCEKEKMLETPAQFLFDFLDNHGFLNIRGPQWFYIKGGSHQYVNKILQLPNLVYQKKCPVSKVLHHTQGAVIVTKNGHQMFDKVIMATHANDTLALLGNPTEQEKEILSKFSYQNNDVILHYDTTVLPNKKMAWAAWNYRVEQDKSNLCRISYNMNILQKIQSEKVYCVSLNQRDLIDMKKIIAQFNYAHPVYSTQGYQTQLKHLDISGIKNVFYCGAYWGYGFHEDGVKSALHIGEQLGGGRL